MPTVDADVSIAYETRGIGPPLVLLHGGWLDRRLWTPQLERFADRRTVVAVDLRDHGASGHAAGDYRVADLADDVRVLLDGLDLERPVVGGLSLGSLVAQRLAATAGDRLDGLVLAGAPASIPPAPLSRAFSQSVLPGLAARANVRLLGPGAAFRQLLAWVETMEGGPWLATTDAARAYALEAVASFDADRFLRVFEALSNYEPVDVSAVDVPALVVHGDREARTVVRQTRRIARLLGADRVAVDGAGHLVNRDNPAAFGDAVEGFLDSVAY
jgi:pimeloyl-ACP methyl ester carboxylesterase